VVGVTDEPGQSRPALSVVIPTYNDARCLELTLRSLTRQTLSPELFEVVVVKDGSTDGYEEIEDHGKGLTVRVVELPARGGRAAARNAGLARASGRIIVFLDSDSYADPELLARHHAFHDRAATPRVLLGRRYEIDWPQLSHLIRDEAIPADLLAPARYGDMRFPPDPEDVAVAECLQTPWLFANTNNISAPAEALTAVGGFDERFGTKWGWEDTELFYRVYLHLGRDDESFAYDQDAICYHLPHYRDMVTWQTEFIANRPLVKRMHPHLDWEFHGFRMPDVLSAKIRGYRRVIDECLRAGACRLPDRWDWVAPRLAARDARRVLWIGTGTERAPIGDDALTFDYSRPVSDTNFHLVGAAMPLSDDQVDAVVSIDFWRCLPWVDFCDFLREATRVAPVALLVHTGADLPGQQVSSPAEVDYLSTVLAPYFAVTPDRDGTVGGLWVRKAA
jgi:glycosyltransferase involved in cell wall biosynthesis